MNESINIREYISMFKKRKWIILLILLASIGAGVLINYKREKSYIPLYQSNTRIRVNSMKNIPEQGFSPGLTSANQNIATTYLNLAKSKNTLNEIKNTLDLKISIEALSSKINVVTDESNAEFINITVTDTDPAMATTIANAVPTAFNNELIKTINLDCIQVIDLAVDSKIPLPQASSNITIKLGIVGVVVAIFVVLLLEFLNNKIITPKDVEQYWDEPLLGVVPYDKKKHPRKSKKLKTT